MKKIWSNLREDERTPKAGYQEASRRIDDCHINRGIKLDLANLNLEEIPATICKLHNLKTLIVSSNRIYNLKPLETLNHLVSLDISKNRCKDLGALANLIYLDKLFLDFNGIESLSPISNLNKLTLLSITGNYVEDIRPLINLSRLKYLNLNGNNLGDLSSLAKMTSLRKVDLQGNEISDLRPLKKLLLANTPIIYKAKPTQDKYINLYDCKIRNLPLEVLEQGNDSIFDYWAEQDRLGTNKAYEGRLMIIGEGKVGKTTLLEKIKNKEYELNPDEPQTHGINIWRDWAFPVPKTNAIYNASIWDFGGQDIQHLTHQYFFTPGTVYLLVVNKRGSNAASEASQLNYWFRIIELMGRYDGQKARVLVVHNFFAGDKTSQGVNLAPYQKRYSETLRLSYKEVNLSIDSGAFDDLRNDIQKALIDLPGVGDNIIAGWPAIRQRLGWIRRRNYRRITWRDFSEICGKEKIKEEASLLLLSRYLVRLGELLHYEHGGLLFDNILLDIDWITTAVYGITENQAVIDRNGRFTREEIVEVWKGNGITDRSDHELMLQLLQMDAFELCWQTDKGDYLTPTLFSNQLLTGVKAIKANLGLRFHYDYLPKGLLGQLIVRLHKHLEADHYWKDGIFLTREGCRARVSRPLVEKDGERIIEILVEGEAPRHYALLSWVVEQLETIHQRSFPRIKFEREIPCPCKRCVAGKLGQHYFPYAKLRDLQREGDTEVTCANNGKTQIKRLLEGMQQLEKQSPMNFAENIRQLVANNRLADALALLDRQYPSDATAALSGEYKQLQSDKIMGVLRGDDERLVSNQIKARLLKLASTLAEQHSEQAQKKTVEEQLPEIRAQLDRMEATGQDTNEKVTALGQILLHVGKEVEDMRGDLFESRQEERQFMRKLEETVEQLPAAKQPGEEWYDRPAKAKIKVALDLLALVPGMSLKWEKEMSTDGARVPRSWGEFKGWFLG